MGYLVQKTRVASLTIGGADYTASLLEFQVSDSSAQKQGLMLTTGSLTLGQRPGQTDIQDYDRNIFKRGTEVTLDLTTPGGSTYRHPRGLLYVISVSYDVEEEQLVIDLGCRLALMSLIDDASTILPLVPIPLDPVQQTIQNADASFSSAGKVLYQDNQGNLVSRTFFGTDGPGGVEAGSWASVLGETAISAEPLGSSNPIPDEINLSYQVPSGELAGDDTGKVDTVTEISQYFVNYPVTIFERINECADGEGEDCFDAKITVPTPSTQSSGCGNVPTPPDTDANVGLGDGEQAGIQCSEKYKTQRVDKYEPATRTTVSTTTYGAPGGQVSFIEQTVTGPAVEASPSYFADQYAYCTSIYGYNCNPNGNCPVYGMDTITLSRTITQNFYDTEDNSLSKTIQDNYANKLTALQPTDYRSGINNGRPQNFSTFATDQEYRRSRVVTEYYKENNANVQLTTTFSSLTSRGIGVTGGGSIDALDGIKTTVKRISVSNTTLDVRPDSVNSPTTATETRSSKILLNTSSYQTPPTESGPYILDESIPVPLLSTDEAEIQGWVDDYTEYLTRFIKGDLYGLRIAESMRTEIVGTWYPGMPFRYVDSQNNRILAMRMDACAWGVTQDEAIVVTNGVWIGFSSGTLTIGNNLVGNSAPDLVGSSPTAPPAVDAPPSISNDIVGQSFAFEVDVDLMAYSTAFTYFEDGVSVPIQTTPISLTVDVEQTAIAYVDGFIVAAGGLLETTGTGSIPLDNDGLLVVDSATIVNADLFA